MEKKIERLLKKNKDGLYINADNYRVCKEAISKALQNNTTTPGICKKAFFIHFAEKTPFGKNDILMSEANDNVKLKVIKTYKFTWWRKILFYFGFKIKSCNCIKVKEQ